MSAQIHIARMVRADDGRAVSHGVHAAVVSYEERP